MTSPNRRIVVESFDQFGVSETRFTLSEFNETFPPGCIYRQAMRRTRAFEGTEFFTNACSVFTAFGDYIYVERLN